MDLNELHDKVVRSQLELIHRRPKHVYEVVSYPLPLWVDVLNMYMKLLQTHSLSDVWLSQQKYHMSGYIWTKICIINHIMILNMPRLSNRHICTLTFEI